MMFRAILIGTALLALLLVASLAYRSAVSKRPSRLAAQPAELPPCGASPNCVSSQADDAAHRVAPLPLDGTPAEAIERARAAIESLPRTRIVTAGGGYLHAEYTSLFFRFVDDLELVADPAAGVLQVRSASRTGYSDLGANRRRVEALRALLEG